MYDYVHTYVCMFSVLIPLCSLLSYHSVNVTLTFTLLYNVQFMYKNMGPGLPAAGSWQLLPNSYLISKPNNEKESNAQYSALVELFLVVHIVILRFFYF